MGPPQPKRCFEASVAKRGLFETASAPTNHLQIGVAAKLQAPQAVRRKAHRRRERFSPAFEHLWRLRPPLFLEWRTCGLSCHRMSAANGLVSEQHGRLRGTQQIAAWRLLHDSRTEPLDQPRLADDQAVAVSRAGKRSTDEAD